ncbi:jg24081 [Pararge aegeria aegeria]|uniref:Jg24081 protein n=2 Tax=Pararge aegeria TaxID=116150 RepID=A0A8S4RI95_9NEOP|nr:jg24081 [Pararge aegeria aegeria]
MLTTSSGAPVSSTDANSTLNTRLLFNEHFMDLMASFVRERIPLRIIHAKAAGGWGYFEVTHDITHVCRAKLFSKVGKRTKVAVRFSPAFQQRGGNDLDRNLRGFSVKFYTEDGIFDIVGANAPVFCYKDPRLFTSFVHSQSKNPVTDIYDPNMIWDFLTLTPEALFMYLMAYFGDRGIPDGYRHMPGFGVHTYQVENVIREAYFIRFHFTPDAGLKNLRSDEARRIQSRDPDYFTRDLYRAIGNGDYPSWTVSIQVLTLAQVHECGSYVFDVTRILPVDKYPLWPVGKLVLNQNVVNYFLETEQIAFNPANLVPGILGGPDHLFEARRFAYKESQFYRLGVNYNKISVNCPFNTKVLTYNRNGRPPIGANGYDIPNYYPNSFNGPVPYLDNNSTTLIELIEGKANNYDQVTDYVNGLNDEEFNRLVGNILYSLRQAVKFIQKRAVRELTFISSELGRRIAQGLLSDEY